MWMYFSLLSFPVILVYTIGSLWQPLTIGDGDIDFFYAMSEAGRKIILDYHQFPWWNPWIGGGIPLFADPQFGLFSIHSMIILVSGTALGWKLSLLVYVLIGLFGLRLLFKKVFKTPEITAALLALTWSLSWLWIMRGAMGHYTFFVMCFLPWLLVFYFQRNKKYSWLWFGLTLALLINTSVHYLTVMSLVFFTLLFLADITSLLAAFLRQKQRDLRVLARKTILPTASFFVKAAAIALPLSALKLYTTLNLSKEFQRSGENPLEEFSGWRILFNSVFGLQPANGSLLASNYSSQEATVGIGIGVFVVVCIIIGVVSLSLFAKIRSRTSVKRSTALLITSPWLYVGLATTFLLLACGDFSTFAPFTFLRELPFFNQTRVAVRWLIFVGFTSLFIVATFKTKSKQLRFTINIILSLNILYLAIVGVGFALKTPPNLVDTSINPSATTTPPLQASLWRAPRAGLSSLDENLYLAVRNNVDQITTSLIPYYDTRTGSSVLCNEQSPGCNYVLTGNATVERWSPHHIVLKRTSPGSITLNVSPGKYWSVNNNYPFGALKSTDQAVPFTITDTSQTIVLAYHPHFGIK